MDVRRIVLIALLAQWFSRAPARADDAPAATPARQCNRDDDACIRDARCSQQKDPGVRALCVRRRISTSGAGTLQGLGATADAMQVVAQVVVDRATQAAWGVLEKELIRLLQCNGGETGAPAPRTRFPNVCQLLGHLAVQDLVAAPSTLLNAAGMDFLQIVNDRFGPTPLIVSGGILFAVIEGVSLRWRLDGSRSAIGNVVTIVRRQVEEAVRKEACPSPVNAASFEGAVLWVVAQCVADAPKADDTGKTPKLEDCDLEPYLNRCGGSESDRIEAGRLAGMVLQVIGSKGTPFDRARPALGFAIAGARRFIKEMKEPDPQTPRIPHYLASLDGLELFLMGLLDQDWTQAAAGALGTLSAFAVMEGRGTVAEQKFFQILAGIGQYATTVAGGTTTVSPEAVARARRDVLDSMLRGLVNRAHREQGAVFSLGGSFGLGGVYRQSFDGATRGGTLPFLLPIGIGMQTYGKGMGGFHAQLAILDLGQYVALESGSGLKVGTPNAQQAVAPSLTIGVWGFSREVPLFIGLQGGVAPFLRNDGNLSWFAGGMIGAYVPFIDFN